MTFYSGLDGQLYLGTSGNTPTDKIGKVQNWTLNASQAVLETTSLEDTDRTLINGVRSMSGSCRMFYHADASIAALIDNIIKGGATDIEAGQGSQSTDVVFKLQIDETDAKYIEVGAWITGASMSMAVGEVFAVDFTFEVSGYARGVAV